MQDAPPSYDALEPLSLPPSRDEKADPSTSSTELSSLTSPRSASSSSRPKLPAKGEPAPSSTSWWNPWSEPPAVKEVRKTLVGLLHDLVRGGDAECVLAVLDSCAGTCKSYGISLSSILQERSAAGHTPLYWAVVNRPSLAPRAQDIHYLRAILTYAAPLSKATVSDIRLACLHSPNNTLFQSLRRIPAFSPLTEEEKLIMGQSVPLDEVNVWDHDADVLEFSVDFKIPLFQKRMRIARGVTLEFIAKGRLWQFCLLVAGTDEHERLGGVRVTPGCVAVKLALLPNSPPTPLDATLVIEPRAAHGELPSATSTSPKSPTSWHGSAPAVKPPIRVQLRKDQLVPESGSWGRGGMIVVSLEADSQANTLQVE
ncbi:hypothetical protein C8T65DRAFT_587655 [Cerioporus squamosus]|nr:hypothetical protein C8T65DRAFT_587655 [Cerioporus squamosus]